MHIYLFRFYAQKTLKNSVVESKENETFILIQRHYEKSIAL